MAAADIGGFPEVAASLVTQSMPQYIRLTEFTVTSTVRIPDNVDVARLTPPLK
jgi:hypothetical protein